LDTKRSRCTDSREPQFAEKNLFRNRLTPGSWIPLYDFFSVNGTVLVL
jgi:hypothetical protein